MLRFIFLLAAVALGASTSARADDEFFAARQYPGLLTKWHDIQTRMSEDAAHLAICHSDAQACGPEEKQLAALVDAARVQEGRARIGHINRAVNLAIRPVSDLARFGSDRWSTPMETLQAGGGDCEDYAILKFLALREAGFAEADLKLLIVREAAVRSDHAVLAVRLDGEWLLLDNRGFALVRLEDSRYRVLVQLAVEHTPAAVASAAGSNLPPLL